VERVVELTREHMEKAFKLKVPLAVNVNVGDNWDQAH
jgi:DNA polymerase I-like protein with 3'-5' exonuclease and polymerase domains